MKFSRPPFWTTVTLAFVIGGILTYILLHTIQTASMSEAIGSIAKTHASGAEFTVTEPATSPAGANDNSPASTEQREDMKRRMLAAMTVDSEKQSVFQSMCKSDLDELQLSISQEIHLLSANSDLTEPQVVAREALIEKCRQWHDLIESSESGESPYKPSALEQQLLDDMLGSNDNSDARVSAAYDLLGSKDANMIVSAVAYLLSTDENFQAAVAKSAGSSTPIYARNATGEILTVLTCKLEGDCSADSLYMQSLCITDPQACGMSTFGYLSATHSPAYLNDVYVMANAIYFGIRQIDG